MSAYSPIRENEIEGKDASDYEEAASASGCGWFSFCCFESKQRNQEAKYLLQQQNGTERRDSWLINKLNKLKEFSELVAGPKWKNFIRKVGKYCNPKKSNTQCMYSPQSYALNFDDGDAEEDNLFSYSLRFSGPVTDEQQR